MIPDEAAEAVGTVVDQTVELAEIVRGCESPLGAAEAVIAAGYRKVTE
jgi:hypothetical protein